MLGVKYILHKQELNDAWYQDDLNTFPTDSYKMVYKVYPWQVYENKSALPRFFITADYLVTSKNNSLKLIYDKNLDLKNTLILEKKPSFEPSRIINQEVELTSYKSNKILFQTTTDKPALLFISDNYYPDWEARIDGIKQEVLVADYSFRAVEIPQGKHTVEFYYNPKSFKLGIMISLGTLLLITAYLLYNSISLQNVKKFIFKK